MYDIQRYAICTLKPYRPTRYALVETDIIYTVFILILQQFINMKYYHHHPIYFFLSLISNISQITPKDYVNVTENYRLLMDISNL
jgi:hypothetical protein